MATQTIEHIAALADVSRSTVSRVLNNHPSVRPEVRERVLRVIEEQGYAPQAAARSLASSRTNVISLLIPRSAINVFTDPFYPLIIQAITEACAANGYLLMLWMANADMEQQFYHRVVRARHCDGVILLASDIDDPLLPSLIKGPMPIVQIGRHPYFTLLNTVDSENREGARLATTYLIGLGHRRIATINGPLHRAVALDRRDGYKQALLEGGLPIVPELQAESDYSTTGGYAAMTLLLALKPRPTAVFVAGDAMVLGALSAVREAGLRVPDDLSLVGFDDLPLAASTSPPLTTIRQPVHALGTSAVEMLLAQFAGQQDEVRHVRLPVELIVRESCGAPSVS